MKKPPVDTPRIDTDLPPSTDPLSDVLRLLRPTGVLYCNAYLTDPWGIEVPAIAGVMYVEIVTSGHCWLELDGQTPFYVPEGSLVVIPRGLRHRLRSGRGEKTTPLQQIPIERVSERFESMRFGGGGPATRITYYGVRVDPYLSERLIRLLPETLHLRTQPSDTGWLGDLIRLVALESEARQPGSETVITRLADVVVIHALRHWMLNLPTGGQGWIGALQDRYVGKALAGMHRYPERNWQLDSLAREAGLSRSAFSARFSAMLGEPALQYLTTLRMQLAHQQLRDTDDTLAHIAERVGYHSEPAFNRAFKRVMGLAPGAVRKDMPG